VKGVIGIQLRRLNILAQKKKGNALESATRNYNFLMAWVLGQASKKFKSEFTIYLSESLPLLIPETRTHHHN